MTDTQGVVQVATGNLLQGQDVSQRPWFGAGGQGPYVGDAHDAVLLDKLLRTPGSHVPLRFMDHASPVRGQNSAFKGVVAAHENWAWVQDISMTFVNEAFCRLFHLRRDWVVGQVWAPIAHPDDLLMVTQALQRVTPMQPVVVVENRVVVGNGSIRWCQFSNRALYDDDGQWVEWQSVGRDVTERHQLEAKATLNKSPQWRAP